MTASKNLTPLQQKVKEAAHSLRLSPPDTEPLLGSQRYREVVAAGGYYALTDAECEQILALVDARNDSPAVVILRSIQALDLPHANIERADEAKRDVFGQILGAWDALEKKQRNQLNKALARKLKVPPGDLKAELEIRRRETSDSGDSAAASAQPYPSLVDKSDQGNANLLIRLADGNLRYIAELEQWLRWINDRWQVDEHEVFATTAALEVANFYKEEAQRLERSNKDPSFARKWALTCRNKGKLDAMLALAHKSSGVPISTTELDRDQWLLGVQNGVVDLRTGELRKNEARGDYVTKRCPAPYNPDAPAPRWRQTIDEITGSPIPAEYDAAGNVIPATVGRYVPRPALARYFQKALGYSITGATREQKFFLGIGGGSNGKNIAFDAVKHALGGYAKKLPSEVLMVAGRPVDPERPTSLAASLAGARFVLASETKQGARLDENAIKAHTGDAEMTARFLHQNAFEFSITHKIWLMTNNQPTLEHLDDAIRGRLHLMPFSRKWNRPGVVERDPALPDGDGTLKEQLAAEAEGILAWLVQGALLYQREGLDPPAEVVAFTKEYIAEQDHLGRWLGNFERCTPARGARASELFADFCQWCAREEVESAYKTQKSFSQHLRNSRGVAWDDKPRDGTYYGLRSLAGSTPTPPKPARDDEKPAAPAEDVDQQAAHGPPPEAPAKDPVRAALSKVGPEKGRTILAKYGATHLGDLKPEDYPKVIADCDALATVVESAPTPPVDTTVAKSPGTLSPFDDPPAATTDAKLNGNGAHIEPISATVVEPAAQQEAPKIGNGHAHDGPWSGPYAEYNVPYPDTLAPRARRVWKERAIKFAEKGHRNGVVSFGITLPADKTVAKAIFKAMDAEIRGRAA
jgi:putative DNA primase/helicase